MAKRLYTCGAIDNALAKLDSDGYELVQLREGVLGCGDWCCIPPREGMYYFIIREVPLNCWSSAHSVRRHMKLGKTLQAELETAIERQESEAMEEEWQNVQAL